MHTGQFLRLETVVKFFNRGGDDIGYPGKSGILPPRVDQSRARRPRRLPRGSSRGWARRVPSFATQRLTRQSASHRSEKMKRVFLFTSAVLLTHCGTGEISPPETGGQGGSVPSPVSSTDSVAAPSATSSTSGGPSSSGAMTTTSAGSRRMDRGRLRSAIPTKPSSETSSSPPTGAWKNVTANLAGRTSHLWQYLDDLRKTGRGHAHRRSSAKRRLEEHRRGTHGDSWGRRKPGRKQFALLRRPSSSIPDSPTTFWTAGIRGTPLVAKTTDDGLTFASLTTDTSAMFGNGPDDLGVDYRSGPKDGSSSADTRSPIGIRSSGGGKWLDQYYGKCFRSDRRQRSW